jgi:hypothetical protein
MLLWFISDSIISFHIKRRCALSIIKFIPWIRQNFLWMDLSNRVHRSDNQRMSLLFFCFPFSNRLNWMISTGERVQSWSYLTILSFLKAFYFFTTIWIHTNISLTFDEEYNDRKYHLICRYFSFYKSEEWICFSKKHTSLVVLYLNYS